MSNAIEHADRRAEELRPEAAKARPFMLNAQIGFLEALFVVMEFTFGVTVCQSLLKAVLSWLVVPVVGAEWRAHFVFNTMSSIIMLYWVLFRFCRGLQTPIRDFVQDCFVFSSHGKPMTISSFAVKVIVIQFVGSFLMAWATGFKYYSLHNYLVEATGEWNICNAIDMIILGPLREEIVFRGVVVAALYRRIGGYHPKYKIKVCLMSGFVFGMIHGVNLFSSRFSQFYIVLQVVFGFLVGYLYAARFMKNGLLEPLVFHIANNIVSSFLRTDLKFSLEDPLLLLSLSYTLVFYAAAAYYATQDLKVAGMVRFPPIDGVADDDDVDQQALVDGGQEQPEEKSNDNSKTKSKNKHKSKKM